MGHERWYRGQHDGQGRPFDWLTAARQHGIPDKLAQVLYEQAVQQAHGATQDRVQELYLALLAGAREDVARPSPGKVTRAMRLQAERAGKRRRSHISPLTGQPIAPGACTLTWYLEPAEYKRHAPEKARESLEVDVALLRAVEVTVPADAPDVLSHLRDSTEEERAGEAVALQSGVARLPEQEISVPGTAAYRRLQADLAAAFGHFEELDALVEERISPYPLIVIDASPMDEEEEDFVDEEVNGRPVPFESQFTRERRARGSLTSPRTVQLDDSWPGMSPEHARSPAWGVQYRDQLADKEEEDLLPLMAIPGRQVENWGAAGSIQAAGLEGIPEMPVRLPDRGGGAQMPEEVRTKMEVAFGVDFSEVRIHEGTHVEAVGALAYTQGTDIHFAPGHYHPTSQSGQELLAHELMHVVQQSQGRVQATTQAGEVNINDDASLEREADEMGVRAAREESATATAGSSTEYTRPSPGSSSRAPIQRHDDNEEERQQQPQHRRVFIIGSPSPNEIRVGHPYQFVDAARHQGVDRNTVWIVEQTGYAQGRVDLNYIERLISQGELIWISQTRDVVSVLNGFPARSIRSLQVFSHGVPGQVTLRYGWASTGLPNYGLDMARIDALRQNLFEEGAAIRFDSCNTGTDSDAGNLAQGFAAQTGADVEAWTGRTSYSEVNNGAADGRTAVEGSQIVRGGRPDFTEVGSRLLGRTPEVRTFSPVRGQRVEEIRSHFQIDRRLPETRSFEVPAGGAVAVTCPNLHLVTDEEGAQALEPYSVYTSNGTAMEPEDEYVQRMDTIQGRVTMVLHRKVFGPDSRIGSRPCNGGQMLWSNLEAGTYYLEIYRSGGHSYPVRSDIIIEVYGPRR